MTTEKKNDFANQPITTIGVIKVLQMSRDRMRNSLYQLDDMHQRLEDEQYQLKNMLSVIDKSIDELTSRALF